MTTEYQNRIKRDFEKIAKETIKIDTSSSTEIVYGFCSELAMYRIAEAYRNGKNFDYGYSKNFSSYYVSLDLSN